MNRHASKNTSLETTLGTLSFGIEADAGDVDAFHISIRPVAPELPWGMSVEACVAVLLKGTCFAPTTGTGQFAGMGDLIS